jgi:hypothetical protein
MAESSVKFKPLLDHWKRPAGPLLTAEEYRVRLPLDDASRLHALAALFPGRKLEEIITDLLHVALDEIAESMPYEPGPRIISRDDHGDPVYEDAGLTPRFVELTRQFRKSLAAAAKTAPTAPVPPQA